TYALARRVASDPVSLLSAILVAVSPFQIMAGQEARMYPLLGALVLAATLALTEAVARGGAVRWLIYAALVTLTAGTDYLGLLVLAAHGVWIACCERRFLGRWLAAAGAGGAAHRPPAVPRGPVVGRDRDGIRPPQRSPPRAPSGGGDRGDARGVPCKTGLPAAVVLVSHALLRGVSLPRDRCGRGAVPRARRPRLRPPGRGSSLVLPAG